MVVIVCAILVKYYYSTTSVDQLRWILAPTTLGVELVTGFNFEFESHAGYMISDRSFLIAAPCAGVNFLITAFLMLSLRRLWSWFSKRSANLSGAHTREAGLPTSRRLLQYVRISTSLWLRGMADEMVGEPESTAPRRSIFVYLGSCFVFIVSEACFREGFRSTTTAIGSTIGFTLLFITQRPRDPLATLPVR